MDAYNVTFDIFLFEKLCGIPRLTKNWQGQDLSKDDCKVNVVSTYLFYGQLFGIVASK